MGIGDRIRALRTNAGMTQIELANKLNISNSTLSQYESGARTPSDDMKLKIAALFQVSIDSLLGVDIKKASTLDRVDAKELQLLKELVDQLTPEQQQELLRYGRYLASLPSSSGDS